MCGIIVPQKPQNTIPKSTRLAHRRSSRRPDHGPVPFRLPGPLPQALPAEDEGEDEHEEEPQADHGHGDEGGLHADGVHHGVDVEGDHEGDDVLEAAYQGQGVGALSEVWSWGVNDVWLWTVFCTMGEVGLSKIDLQQSTGYVNTTVVEACIPKMKTASPTNGLREMQSA